MFFNAFCVPHCVRNWQIWRPQNRNSRYQKRENVMSYQSPVEMIDYNELVKKLKKAVEVEEMIGIIIQTLNGLGEPRTHNEIKYFWFALFNAAKQDDKVWLWFSTLPYIRRFAPPSVRHWVLPHLLPDLRLPPIGGPDDKPYRPGDECRL
jgi:hypothetical protein